MSGQNDFLIFDENGENILSQEIYQDDEARINGFKAGIARSNVNNKVLHQVSKMCHAIGEIGKENGVVVSDLGSVEDLKTALKYSFGGATRDLDNLTSAGEKHFLNKSQITNCLLEVPQNIKLELKDGELTLKAGSKLIFPKIGNQNQYTEKVTTTDAFILGDLSVGEHLIFDAGGAGDNSLRYCPIENIFNTEPTNPVSNATWYDLTNNVIRAYQEGAWIGSRSFPICKITVSNNGITIDQVFNGFGCIGSLWWVDKDVEALISRGYNNDGTINNLVVKTTKVAITNQPASARLVILNEQGNLESIVRVNYIESEETPSYTGTSSNLWYNPKTLEWKQYNATLGEWLEKPALPIAWDIKNSAGQITDFGFIREKTFRTMDYNEANEAFAKPHIGQIIQATVSADYVPEGTLPCDGAEYSATQFNDLYSNWLVSGKLKTCTYTEYSNMIATYGQCPMWALDTTNRKFKVPLIKDGAVIQQALSDSELGKAYNAGLPNIEGTVPTFTLWETGTATGVFALNTPSGGSVGGTGAPWYSYIATMDASNSSSIYGNSDTVQMNAVAVRFFVVVATGSINQSQMDWSAWASSLANKANVDLSNCTKPYIIETYKNGTSWYRVWSDGWCEQGGVINATALSMTISFLKSFKDTNYNFVALGAINTSNGFYNYFVGEGSNSKVLYTGRTTSSCVLSAQSATNWKANWKACGYIS